MADVFIYDVIRTPRGRGKAGKGGLSQLHPQELLAQTLNRMADRLHLDKGTVDDLAIGCVTQVKEQGACIARNALIAAQWPDDVTGFTINRFCGSGLEAVNSIAAKIGAGYIDAGVGGGVESMSRVPMGADGAMLDGLNEQLRKRVFIVPQGISADLIATREGFTRADVDAFALASQQKAARAIEEQRFARSLFTVTNLDGTPALDRDEHPRPDTTAASLAALAPAFTQLGATPMGPGGETVDALALKVYPDTKAIEHVHTAGNSSGIVDGAATVLMGSKEWGERAGLKPRAKIRAAATAGAEPVIMLTAPAPASAKRAGKRAGMTGGRHRPVGDQRGLRRGAAADHARARHRPRAGQRQRRRDRARPPAGRDRRDPPGHRARRARAHRQGHRAGITLCIGGGMGIATIIERV
jgi:acetyl-CoA C-acetyltransferase